MVLRLFNYALLSRFQPLFDDSVSALAVQPYFSLPLEYHRHTFSHVVEVEDAEEFVNLVLTIEVDGYRTRRPLGEDKTKVPVTFCLVKKLNGGVRKRIQFKEISGTKTHQSAVKTQGKMRCHRVEVPKPYRMFLGHRLAGR